MKIPSIRATIPSAIAGPYISSASAITDFANDVTSQIEDFGTSQNIAEEAISRDIQDSNDQPIDDGSDTDSSSGSSTVRQYSMINSYRRPSYVNPGARGTAIMTLSSSVPERSFAGGQLEETRLSK